MIPQLIILLIIVASVIWVLKTGSYAGALFTLTIGCSVFAFFKGVELLESINKHGSWQGVFIISVSLFVMLAVGIALKVFGQGRHVDEGMTKKAEQAGVDRTATSPESKSGGKDQPQLESEPASRSGNA